MHLQNECGHHPILLELADPDQYSKLGRAPEKSLRCSDLSSEPWEVSVEMEGVFLDLAKSTPPMAAPRGPDPQTSRYLYRERGGDWAFSFPREITFGKLFQG